MRTSRLLRPGNTPIGRALLLFSLVLLLAGCAAGSGPARHGFQASPFPFSRADALQALFAPAPWPSGAMKKAPGLDIAALEQALQQRVNEVRADHGLAPTAWADELAVLARAHSRDMADHGFFDHIDPRGRDAMERAQQSGVACQVQVGRQLIEGVGENLFLTHRYSAYQVRTTASGEKNYSFEWKSEDEMVEQAVQGWMESASHRENLLSPIYRSSAIGAALGDNATLFVTQQFTACEPHALRAAPGLVYGE